MYLENHPSLRSPTDFTDEPEFTNTGLIEQGVGSGTFVADDVRDKLPPRASSASMVSPAELMDARIVLEPVLVDLVVSQGTPPTSRPWTPVASVAKRHRRSKGSSTGTARYTSALRAPRTTLSSSAYSAL